MNKDSRILVTGHRGLAGSAVCRALKASGYDNLITWSHEKVDLTNPVVVRWAFSSYQPEYVFHCAAKVGGIVANSTKPVEFMLDNMRIEMNVLENAKNYGVKKLLFLGSACAYPKLAQNPIFEEYLLTGALEPSNECYALAKIAGIKLCEAYRKEYGCNFISVMPTNLYGLGDSYDPQNSHVIPGMIRRVHERVLGLLPGVTFWGTGKPTREFLFADDLAVACILLMDCSEYLGLVNIGSGELVALRDLAAMVVKVAGHSGPIEWDITKPDGTPERRLDSSKIFWLGWRPKITLEQGLQLAYQDFRLHLCHAH
jgi:GDP-L-fucose synthase